MQQTARFSLGEANELAQAMLAHTAREAGIRSLAIKGLVADRYGLRTPRVAADADVMVDPGRFGEFCSLLAARGWHQRVEREVPSLLGEHSVTLIHTNWPNDLDVHIRFLGFFSEDVIVFDKLWQTREVMEVAHVSVPVPSRPASAVIAALHALRHPKSARHTHELDRVIELLDGEFTEDEKAEFFEVARAGRAQWVLRDLWTRTDVPYVIDLDAEQQRRWNIYCATTEDGSAVSWLSELRGAAWLRKPAILFRALWIARADIPRNDPEQMPTTREAWSHRLLRWRRGGISLIRFARARRRPTDP